MIADTNSLWVFFGSTVSGAVGGNTLFLGIAVFLIVTILLVMAKAKASTSVMVGVSVAFVFSAVTVSASSFMWLFWLGIIVAVFMIVMGIVAKFKGQ